MKKIALFKRVLAFITVVTGGLLVAGCEPSLAQNEPSIYTALPVKSDSYYQPFSHSLKAFSNQLSRTDRKHVITITNQSMNHRVSRFSYDDIWVRDVAPVITTKMVKFKYGSNYLPKADASYLDRQFRTWLDEEGFNYQVSNLVLDGGNLIWNGHDTVILTNHVFDDNPGWTRSEIVSELKSKLNVKRVIFIPVEPGDVLGHADGMVKFISRNELYVSDFSGNHKLLRKVEHQIKSVIPNAKFVVLPSAYTSRGQYDRKIASAKGLYINMLETPTKVYVPQYGLSMDHKVLKIIRSHTHKKLIPINVGKISTMGGSVHCLTWDVPKTMVPEK
ncbi:putative agmatine deiminase [Lentilactobacillus sunkii]|jgi:agmatine/peptidylarginine deiminase|uniref:Putative agmatine deiminase n=1 Tax=Lentilactobacillus sunkii TaxID=481719 RepID=A0A1E7XJA1_9LACO|nr:agmatine deiminase family protein [Lentilactobacillus sunkii]OFA13171.1 putative agmatine deiminase [Lentilactobacillus sunkii]